MRVLGIDPGYDRMGIAVMEHGGHSGTLLYSTCLTTTKDMTFPLRIAYMGAQVAELLKKFKPEAVALERLFFSKNQKTALNVAEVRGAMVYLAEVHGCRVCEYTPQEVKVAVTGYGKSDKGQVEAMVKRLIPQIPLQALDDEYDAIAIAMTCLAINPQNMRGR